MSSMYRKYLLKKDFWAVPKKTAGDEPTCYVKHDVKVGGIYAYLQHRGVRIFADGKSSSFSNFDELDEFLNRLNHSGRDETQEFMSILNRRSATKLLRQVPL